MEFRTTSLPGVLVVEPDVYRDARGFFLETYNAEQYHSHIPDRFVQDNHSLSGQGTLRGLHLQNPNQQGKLVRVTKGEVFDVAVDVRVGSPTYGQWHGEYLTEDNFLQMYLPAGFAHGFCVVSESAEFVYKCTNVYHPEHELVIAWNDPLIAIDWPISRPVMSERDKQGLSLDEQAGLGRLPAYSS